MKLFTYPKWLLRFRRSTKPTEDPPPFDLVVTRLPAPDASFQGTPGTTGHGCTPSPRDSLSGGFPSKIRKRFSQESARLRARNSLFGMALNPQKLLSDPGSSGNLGSGLMNESDYDSDAQHIPSLRRRADSPHGRFRSSLHVPSLSPCINEEVEDVSGSHSLVSASNEQMTDAGDRGKPPSDDPPPAYQPYGSHQTQSPCVLPSQNHNDCLPGRVATPQPPAPMILQGPRPPDLSSMIPESQLPSLQENASSASTSESTSEQSPSVRTGSPPLPSATAPGVPVARYSQISIRKRRQTLYEQRPNHRSVHLRDLNIPGALALSPTSSEDSPEDGHSGEGKDDHAETSDEDEERYEEQDSDVPSDRSTWGSGPKDVGATRDVSWSSSHHTSFSSAPSTSHFERRALSHLYTNPPTFEDQRVGSPCPPLDPLLIGENLIPPGFKQTRAYEPQGENQPASSLPARRVSVGWMTGGRRLGYGYSVVPTEERSQESPGISDSTATAAEVEVADDSDDSDDSAKGKGNPTSLKIRKSISSIFSTGHRGFSKKAGGGSVTPSLWGKMKCRKKHQNETGAPECSSKAQSNDCDGRPIVDNTQDPQKKADVAVGSFRSYLSKRGTLRHAMNLWRRRGVTEDSDVRAQTEKPSPCASTSALEAKELPAVAIPAGRPSLVRPNDGSNPVLASTDKGPSSSTEKNKHHIPTLIFLDGLDIQAQIDQIAEYRTDPKRVPSGR